MRRQRLTPKPVIMRASANLLRTSRGAQKSNFGDRVLCGGDRDVEQGPYVPS